MGTNKLQGKENPFGVQFFFDFWIQQKIKEVEKVT